MSGRQAAGEAGETGPYGMLRSLIDRVVVSRPEQDSGRYPIEIAGKLARLIGGEPFPQCSMLGGTVVAEEGVEPPTPGL